MSAGRFPVNLLDPLCFSFGPRQARPFRTVTAAFFHYAKAQPDAIAARDFSQPSVRTITYGELASRSRRLATHLRTLGVEPGDRVPLVVKRGIEMLVGIIAILSCGAQYVPLDGGVVPDTTLRVVLEQSGGGVAVCLASTEYRLSTIDEKGCRSVIIDEEIEELKSWEGNYPIEESFVDLAREDLGCYVIYTSGTTGAPKGVDVTHENVTNLIGLSPGNLGIKPGVRVGSVLNISFDMGAWEILGSLCNGGTLILRGSDWAQALREIEVLICTPSILAKYSPDVYPNIKMVATAGEPSGQRIADLWASHGTYYNCCGPTETTIVNTMHKHIPGGPLTIGAPTPNNSVYVLDEDLQPVPVGQPGLMWGGGLGITRGYINLPDTTAVKYRPDTFANDGSMMYNTGDIGQWRPDGVLDILGRADDQVKVKGFRVELDGVSASLNRCPGVIRATALLIQGEIHGYLEPMTINLDAVKQQLTLQQPYYAVPSKFHLLETLPETSNGKLDKKLLRAMAGSAKDDKLLASSASGSNISTSGSETSGSLMKGAATNGITVSAASIDEKSDLSADIPDKSLRKPFRGLIYRVFIVYRFLFSLVGLGNVGALIAILFKGVDRQWLGTMTAINLVLAVLIRQDFVINALYTICCSVPTSWPLLIRKKCAKIYHLGGVHSSAAVCAAMWLLASNISNITCQLAPETCIAGEASQSLATAVVSWILTAFFLLMFGFAWPPFRKRNHDLFEKVHRFVGWTMLGLFWVQAVLSVNDSKPAHQSLGSAWLRAPTLWLLVVATCSIALSWLYLRRVRVDAEVLSPHAVRLHFDYTVPVNGSFTRISRKPLFEWHSFATIPAPQAVNGRSKGYSLVVSNAGDWTKDIINNPPTHLWVRSVPTCGVMRIATLFNRVVVIATGSGIGPQLGHLQNPSCPTKLIWSTPNPEKTFGRPMLDAIREKIPDAVIHDTKLLGRPDLVKMGYSLAKSSGAEAVIIIANEKITKKVVYGLETRGIPAYGAIWDS
ncbi:AMP-binding enzyme [Truncatella angustata]|uniref:AMP-binding enzyme n=1 Tax=Truncatella angustata TaxID=152316 RepID=A0A9P9A0A8_9PEZI|nr:AMP-binding enzyme [Truncatella angustata]KAH6657078.1 AMP-binding enzyme [Truncatella angustata]